MSGQNQGRNRGGRGQDGRQDDKSIAQQLVNAISAPDWNAILKDGGLVDAYTKKVRNDFNATQLRRFFNKVKEIDKMAKAKQGEWEVRIWQLVPAAKYAKGRSLCPESFADFISQGVAEIDKAKDEQKFKRLQAFVQIFEAIVAYHKYNGGK